MSYLIHVLVEAGIIILGGFIFSNHIKVKGLFSAIIAAIIIGLLNASLGRFLDFILGPINFITLGLVGLIINAFMIKLADWFLPGLKIDGFLYAIILSLLLSAGNYFFL
jgi:putative membrane protein